MYPIMSTLSYYQCTRTMVLTVPGTPLSHRSMSDEQVRRVFVKFMHDISMRIEHGVALCGLAW